MCTYLLAQLILQFIFILSCIAPPPTEFVKGRKLCEDNCRRPLTYQGCDNSNPKFDMWTFSLLMKKCNPVQNCYGNNNTFGSEVDCTDLCSGCKTILNAFKSDDTCIKEVDDSISCTNETKTMFHYIPSYAECYSVLGCKEQGYFETYEACIAKCPKIKL